MAAPLPDREADLDFVVHALQRWTGDSHAGGVLRPDRTARLAQVVLPAPRDRRQFDRGLRHELDDGALRGRCVDATRRPRGVFVAGAAVRAGAPWRGRSAGVLVDPVL